MGSANFPGRPFALRTVASIYTQEIANNRTLLHTELWIDKLSYSPTWSGSGNAHRNMTIDGGVFVSDYGQGFDFRNGNNFFVLAGDIWIGHNADGSKGFTFAGNADYALLGAVGVSEWINLPPIPRNPPPPPLGLGLDQPTRTTLRYQFTGQGDGGSPIQEWQAQIALDPGFTTGYTVSSSGTTVFGGLATGRKHYARSRGRNSVGWGGWSNVSEGYTRSGAYLSDGAAWVPAEVLISDGAAWVPAEVLISDGAAWQPAG